MGDPQRRRRRARRRPGRLPPRRLAGARGHVAAEITLPAESLRQAATTALAIAETGAVRAALDGADVLALEVLPTAEFDQRNGLDPMPELVSVTEAAEELDVSRQAVLQRLESGSLPGTKVGKTWVVQARALEPFKPTA
ncbi:helix-turn-helix domain-containing protein [Oerskovia sp. M15]